MNTLVISSIRFAESLAANAALIWGTYGWAVGLLLIAVLSAKEMARAYGGPQTVRLMRTFNLAVVPLLIVFAVAILGRILPLIQQP